MEHVYVLMIFCIVPDCVRMDLPMHRPTAEVFRSYADCLSSANQIRKLDGLRPGMEAECVSKVLWGRPINPR